MGTLSLPPAPDRIEGEQLWLVFDKIVPEDKDKGLVPFYHFRIALPDGSDIGYINFRVGDIPHIMNTAGHIGYEIKEQFRGHAYSYHACCALLPFVSKTYPSVIMTANPENNASIKIIERLGANFIEETIVPPEDPSYKNGARIKRKYELVLK